MARLSDSDAIALAAAQGRAIVTLDKDLTRLVATSGARGPSVIFLRLEDLDRVATVSVVMATLAACEREIQRGSLVPVSASGIRVRALPLVAAES